MAIKTEITTNGYTAEGLQKMIVIFEKVAADLFPGCTVRHNYYGNHLDMVGVLADHGSYARFNITADRAMLLYYTCSDEDLGKFQSMTHKDGTYDGKLLKLANA